MALEIGQLLAIKAPGYDIAGGLSGEVGAALKQPGQNCPPFRYRDRGMYLQRCVLADAGGDIDARAPASGRTAIEIEPDHVCLRLGHADRNVAPARQSAAKNR